MTKLNGVFSGVVTERLDPENLARVKVRLPRLSSAGQKSDEVWACMSTSMAGKIREA